MSNKKLNTLIDKGIFDKATNKLEKYDFANLFDVINKGEKSYYNLCKNISFNNNEFLDENLYQRYVIMENDSWTNISYKFFKTIKLWWLICKFNNIKDPFNELEAGKEIKIPTDEIVSVILNTIKSY